MAGRSFVYSTHDTPCVLDARGIAMPELIDPSEAFRATPGPALSGNELVRMRRMGQGLGLMIIAIVLAIICGTLQAIFLMAFESDFAHGWFFTVFDSMTLIVPLVLVIGIGFCVAVPARARAARFAIAAILMAVASFVASFVAIKATGRPLSFWESERLVYAFLFAAAVCFLWYLRRLAMFIGERRLARHAMYILIGMLFVYTAGLATPRVEELVAHMTAEGWKALRSLVMIVTVLSYASLIENLRGAVRRLTANA
jgi:hypothetical protein